MLLQRGLPYIPVGRNLYSDAFLVEPKPLVGLKSDLHAGSLRPSPRMLPLDRDRRVEPHLVGRSLFRHLPPSSIIPANGNPSEVEAEDGSRLRGDDDRCERRLSLLPWTYGSHHPSSVSRQLSRR